MATTYTLSWVLPYVRESLRGRSNFNFENYVDGLLSVLERAGVAAIEKRSPVAGRSTVYDLSAAPYDLLFAATEAFNFLIRNGFVIPCAPVRIQGFPNAAPFYTTPSGQLWAEGVEPTPEESGDYIKLLRRLVPALDPIIEQYVSEGLSSFVRGTYFAAAVMIGAASEKAIYLLAESILGALKDASQRAKLEKLLEMRRLNSLVSFVEDTIAQSIGTIPYAVAEGASRHLLSVIESIRIQRNDAVHPMSAQVSADSVRLAFSAFPHVLEKLEAIRTWLLGHPKSI
jgi:hypothetical protein